MIYDHQNQIHDVRTLLFDIPHRSALTCHGELNQIPPQVLQYDLRIDILIGPVFRAFLFNPSFLNLPDFIPYPRQLPHIDAHLMSTISLLKRHFNQKIKPLPVFKSHPQPDRMGFGGHGGKGKEKSVFRSFLPFTITSIFYFLVITFIS